MFVELNSKFVESINPLQTVGHDELVVEVTVESYVEHVKFFFSSADTHNLNLISFTGVC